MSSHYRAQGSVDRRIESAKPPLPPKPRMGAEQKENCASERTQAKDAVVHNDLKRRDNSTKNDMANELYRNNYPCICEHLNIEASVPTPSECREYFLRKSLQNTNMLRKSTANGRDSGNSSVVSSSSSSLSYIPFSNGHQATSTTSQQVVERHLYERQLQQDNATLTGASSGVLMQNGPFETSNVRKALVGEVRLDTLERDRIQQLSKIDDEHKYESLDHKNRPPQLSEEDEGVCCSSIKSKITKKAKELVRPYQKGDHPRDRPPIPAKPPRLSLQKASRPNSNEGISDQESNYKEHLDLLDQVQAAAQTAGGYEAIDTSRKIVPPIPGVPTKGRLTKKESLARQSVALEDMEQGAEFEAVLASHTSIELKGTAKKSPDAIEEAPKLEIDVKVIKDKEQAKGCNMVKSAKRGEPSKPEDEKKSLIKRVKSIRMENPFKKIDADEEAAESGDKSKSGLKKIFSRKDKDNLERLDDSDKPTLSDKISKVFQREKREDSSPQDAEREPSEGRRNISEKLGRIFKTEPKEPKQDVDSTHVDAKKSSLMGKLFSKEPKDSEIDEGHKKSFLPKMFLRDPKDVTDIGEDADKKASLMSRVFSRDARDDEALDSQDKKSFSEKFTDFKEMIFSKKDKEDEDADIKQFKEPCEKKALFEKYFPMEKPVIQQHVLTEEMEPDLKKRRMGKITSFQRTSPAKKILKENFVEAATVETVEDAEDFRPKRFVTSSENREKRTEHEKPDFEVTTQVHVKRTPSPSILRVESANCESEDLDVVAVPVDGEKGEKEKGENEEQEEEEEEKEEKDKPSVDKSTVFYAKVGESEIEVKENHYGRIRMGDKKRPIYAVPLKLLKRSFTDVSKSTPSLLLSSSNRSEEPIEYIDVTELSQEIKQDEPSSGHHYEQLGEPGKKKKLVSKLKVRGRLGGGDKLIIVETELIKGKSMSSLNEPATMSFVRTIEKQKPPVPPRPRTMTPTIIGKPSSAPTTPTSAVSEPCQGALFAIEAGRTLEQDESRSSSRATTPASMVGDPTRRKTAPPRPPPPNVSTLVTSRTAAGVKAASSEQDKTQPSTLRKLLKPTRPPLPKVTVSKSVQKTTLNTDKYSVYCQTDVGLSTDLLAKIERVVSSSFDEGPHKPPRSGSCSRSIDNVVAGSSSWNTRTRDAVLYDEPVRLRQVAQLQQTELSKRISTLQIHGKDDDEAEEAKAKAEDGEEDPPRPSLPPRSFRRCKSESDVDSSDSVYYDCFDDFRSVSWAKEDDVRFYDKVTDESQSNSISQSTPPPSASASHTNLLELSRTDPCKRSPAKDPSLDSDSDWSDDPVKKPSPSLLLNRKPLTLRTRRDLGGSSTDTDNQISKPQLTQTRKRHVKRSPVHSTFEPKILEGFKRHQVSDSGEDTDELLKRAQEVQDQLRQLLSHRTEQLRVCLEADMSSSTDAEPEQGSRSAIQSASIEDEAQSEPISSDSEAEKELTPPPQDSREKALKHAANVAREMASSEAAFVDALKLIVEDFKGAINAGREERGDILIPNEVLDPILLYLPELLKFSSDLLANLNERVKNYDTDKVIADVFVKIGQFLKLYAHYIKDYKARCSYLEDARKKYPEFNQIVQQFEASPRCNKLSVVQYMLKPVQRIPQYRLLLADYFNHLTEDHPDRANAQQGLDIVSAVADHADQTMKQGENHAEMVRLQNSLMSTRFNVFKPGRILIKKGNLLKHNRKTPQLKHVVLFSDCLAYMTQVQSSLNTLKLNRELPLVGLTLKHDEAFPNEFSVLSPSKSFTLIAQNETERQEWIDAIQKTVSVFEQKRRTFQAKSKSTDDSEDSELNHAPVWTPDSRVTMCQICKVSFTTFRRRHHCRSCGIVVCGVCSKREAWLTYNGGAYERVCDTCAVKLPRERLKSTAGLPELTPGTPEVSKENIIFELGSNDDGCTMSGYLKMFKKGSWKRYWYVLKNRVLYVYKASADIAPVEQVVVLGFQVLDIDDAKKADHLDLCFKLRHQGLDDMLLCAEDVTTAAK